MINNEYKITFLHTNDTHSYLDDFAKKAHVINEIKKHNAQKNIDTFLVDSGDTLSGSIYFTMYKGKKEAELLNYLAYDVMTLGNHEFDCGSKLLADFLEIINFPVVVSNLNVEKDKYLSPFTQPDNKHRKIHQHLIKTLTNGKKVGFFGLITESTSESAAPSQETLFEKPLKKCQEMLEYFHNEGISTIILLSHLGLEADIHMANSIKGISLIIGAHSHTLLEEALIIENENHKTIITQAGKHGEHLGEITLTFGKNDSLIKIDSKIHCLQEITQEDIKTKEIIDQIKLEKQKVSSSIICTTQTELNGERNMIQRGETNLGNLVADAFFHAAKIRRLNPDLAIINGGGIRTSLAAGNITFGDIVKVLPFAKTLTLLEATGKQLKEALMHGLFPQVSQMLIIYDLSYSEHQKNRIKDLLILKNGAYEPILDQAVYRIATNSFVGYGKDNFIGFKKANRIEENLELDVNVLIDYLRYLPQPIVYHGNSRIVYK